MARYGCYDAEFSAGEKWIKIKVAVLTFFSRTDWKKATIKKLAVPRRFPDWDL
jgi:hypothetical protein